MEGTYPVMFGKQPVGEITVSRQGLYYRFFCRCRISSQTVYRLMAVCGDGAESLGIVVPMEAGFGLDTRLPVKRFGEGNISFSLVPKLDHSMGKFYPIYPDEPFAYVARLKDAYLTFVEGQAGLLLREN